jgi:hypothetical protein
MVVADAIAAQLGEEFAVRGIRPLPRTFLLLFRVRG